MRILARRAAYRPPLIGEPRHRRGQGVHHGRRRGRARLLAHRWQPYLARQHPAEARDGTENLGGGIAYGGGTLYASTGYAELRALNPASGKLLWQQKLDFPTRSAPLVAGGLVAVVTQNDLLLTFDAASGTPGWRFAGSAGLASTTAVGDRGPARLRRRHHRRRVLQRPAGGDRRNLRHAGMGAEPRRVLRPARPARPFRHRCLPGHRGRRGLCHQPGRHDDGRGPAFRRQGVDAQRHRHAAHLPHRGALRSCSTRTRCSTPCMRMTGWVDWSLQLQAYENMKSEEEPDQLGRADLGERPAAALVNDQARRHWWTRWPGR